MTRPWEKLAQVQVNEGTMTLLRRGPTEFLIRMDHYVLMNSALCLTEKALAVSACHALPATCTRPHLLIGGLGMGLTLRAALDEIPADARITVAELNPVVVDWCRGPLAPLTDGAVSDPRVTVIIGDASKVISDAAREGREKFDGIILDLYQGTGGGSAPDHPFYGQRALKRARKALSAQGILAVWTEETDVAFEKRADSTGFAVTRTKPGKGGPRHVVYLAKKTSRTEPI